MNDLSAGYLKAQKTLFFQNPLACNLFIATIKILKRKGAVRSTSNTNVKIQIHTSSIKNLLPFKGLWCKYSKTMQKLIKCATCRIPGTTDPDCLKYTLMINGMKCSQAILQYIVQTGTMCHCSRSLTPQRNCCMTLTFSKIAGFRTLFGFTHLI